jgi:hypothetical protein
MSTFEQEDMSESHNQTKSRMRKQTIPLYDSVLGLQVTGLPYLCWRGNLLKTHNSMKASVMRDMLMLSMLPSYLDFDL